MSKLHKFNYYFCQFLFFRVTREVNLDSSITLAWGIMFVLPMTGWVTPYVPSKPKFIRLLTTKAGREYKP